MFLALSHDLEFSVNPQHQVILKIHRVSLLLDISLILCSTLFNQLRRCAGQYDHPVSDALAAHTSSDTIYLSSGEAIVGASDVLTRGGDTATPLNENDPNEQCPAQDNCQRLPPNSGAAVILEAAELIGHQAHISSGVVGLSAPANQCQATHPLCIIQPLTLRPHLALLLIYRSRQLIHPLRICNRATCSSLVVRHLFV